jgi:hypothetical protein
MTNLDATDAELDKRTQHLAARDLVCCSTDRAFDEQAVVMGLQSRLSNEKIYKEKTPRIP